MYINSFQHSPQSTAESFGGWAYLKYQAPMPIFIKTKAMKKLSTIIAASVLTVLSATAFACPQGTTLTGGTGANHRGGKCVAVQKVNSHKNSHEKTMAKADAKIAKTDAKTAKPDAQKAALSAQKAKVSAQKASADAHKVQHNAKTALS